MAPQSTHQWKLAPETYCRPEHGFVLADVASLFQERPLAIDYVAKQVFVFGRRIPMKNDTREYRYMAALAQHVGKPLQHEALARLIGVFSTMSDYQSYLREAKADLKAKIERTFSDSAPLRKRALAMLPKGGPSGTHVLDLRQDEIVCWSEVKA